MTHVTLDNFIDGVFQPSAGADWISVWNPAEGQVYARIPDSGPADVARAVAAAQRAFPAWSKRLPAERAAVLERIADLIETHLEALAEAETRDTGKPLWLSRQTDIPRAAQNFRFFAAAIQHFASETHALPGLLNYTLRQPSGVVACISPWNLPLYLLSWKIAPALASGNCVVAKPSEITPFTAHLLAQMCQQAGLPPGVLNVVNGSGCLTGQALVTQPLVKAVSFTGSTRTGATIAAAVAPSFKKLSLEMGGKNAALIFADCDYEATLETLLRAVFSNQGQICLCMSRLLIEKPLYERFRRDFVARASALTTGDPLDSQTRLGALVSAPHQQKVLDHVALALAEGGQLLCGGHAIQPAGRCANGWFVAPTVFEGLPMTCRTSQEEIFGPVVTLYPFETEAEALTLANQSAYGLAATIWTRDAARLHRLAEHLEAGLVWANCWMERDLRTPFGGMKHSGIGREGGWEALRFFSEPKNVCLKF